MCALPYTPQGYVKVTLPLCKDDVTAWFRTVSAAIRIDTVCELLNCCVSSEILFFGTIIEILRKKVSQEMKSAFIESNMKMGNSSSGDSRRELFHMLKSRNADEASDGISTPININTPLVQQILNPTTTPLASNSNLVQSHLSSTTSNSIKPSGSQYRSSSKNSGVEDTQPYRPPSSHKNDHSRTTTYEPPQLRQQVLARNRSPATHSEGASQLRPLVNGSIIKGNSTLDADIYDEAELLSTDTSDLEDLFALDYPSVRQKLILNMSFLSSTNRQSAETYYSLLSKVDRTVGSTEWLESLSDSKLDEVALLYTLGIHHPAFTYEQRLMLSQILLKIISQLNRNKCSKTYTSYYQPVPGYDPPYGHYYVPHIPNIASHVHPIPPVEHQTPPPQLTSAATSVIPHTVDTSRISQFPHVNYYQQPFSPFPVYMTASTPSPQNPGYSQASPIMANVGPTSSAIRSNSPSNIPHPGLVNDALPIAITPDKHLPTYHEGIQPMQSQIIRSVILSCYNCGGNTHKGYNCPNECMETLGTNPPRTNSGHHPNKGNLEKKGTDS